MKRILYNLTNNYQIVLIQDDTTIDKYNLFICKNCFAILKEKYEKIKLSDAFVIIESEYRIKEEKYSETLQEERLNKIKELLLTNQSEMEVSEQFGVNAELLFGGIGEEPMDPINEEGYNQFDEDREEEGDDDGDHDGDYREN